MRSDVISEVGFARLLVSVLFPGESHPLLAADSSELGARIPRSRSDDAVIVELLDDVRTPACDAGHDEQGRVKLDGESEVVVESGGGPVEIWRDAFFFPHLSLDDRRSLF